MRRAALAAVLVGASVVSATADATAPPVGPLPKGPVSTIATTKGALVAVALPSKAGKSWRLARAVDRRVLVEVNEANVGRNVVIVYRAVGRGSVRVAYGLTRGETKRAYASSTFVVRVS
jgi:hypothetical protein